MENREAIIIFSQSEKIKAGLLWASQSLEVMNGLSGMEKPGAERIIHALVNMIDNEIHLARKQSEEMASPWDEAGKHIRMGIVMLNSGVSHEAVFHLSRALSQVTTIGQRSMSFLIEKGLL